MKVWFLCDARITLLFGQFGQIPDQFCIRNRFWLFMSAAGIQWNWINSLLLQRIWKWQQRWQRAQDFLGGGEEGENQSADASDTGFSASCYSIQIKQKINVTISILSIDSRNYTTYPIWPSFWLKQCNVETM